MPTLLHWQLLTLSIVFFTSVHSSLTQLRQDCKSLIVQNKTQTVKLECNTRLNNATLSKDVIRQFPLPDSTTIGSSPYPLTEISFTMQSVGECKLSIEENALSAVPKLTRLTLSLPCENSVLSIFTTELTHTPNLTFLSLKGLPLILELLQTMKNLKELKLEDTGHLNLTPSAFQHLKQLTQLEVSSQTVDLNKNSLANLTNLEKLVLWDVSIIKVPDGMFEKAKKLKYLNLGSNKINKVTKSMLRGLRGLHNLYLDFNEITNLEVAAMKEMPDLEYVGLEHNRLADLPKDLLSGNKKLKYLGVASNKLKKLPAAVFKGLYSLESLFAHNNSISVVEAGAFDHLVNLTTIDLSCNPLSTLPDGLFRQTRSLKAAKLPKRLENSISMNDFPNPLDHLDFVQVC